MELSSSQGDTKHQEGATTKKRKRESRKTLEKASSIFKTDPIAINLSNPQLFETASDLKPVNHFSGPLADVFEKQATALRLQITTSLEKYKKLYRQFVERPFRIPSIYEEEPDAILALSKPEDATVDLLTSPPPAKRAKKAASAPTNGTTMSQSFSESIDESVNLDASFQKDDDPLNRSFDSTGKSSTGGALSSGKSTSGLKQLLLVPLRQQHVRDVPPDPEAVDPGQLHKSFFLKFRISKKFRSVVSDELSRLRRENPSLEVKSRKKNSSRIMDPTMAKTGPPNLIPMNFSDLAFIFPGDKPSQPSPKESPVQTRPSSASPGRASTKKKASDSTAPPKSKASAAKKAAPAKRAAQAASPKPSVPKPPPLTSKMFSSVSNQAASRDSNLVSPVQHDAEPDAASLLIGLSVKSNAKAMPLGMASPTRQLSITQYVSQPTGSKPLTNHSTLYN